MIIENQHKVFIVTGPIGSGKSTFAKMLSERLNALYISADTLGHEVLEENSKVLVNIFGSEAIDSRGNVNRKAIASIVFTDKEKLLALENIVHPAVNQKVQSLILNADRPIVYEVALLEKTNYKNIENRVIIYIDSVHENMIERIISRGLSHDEAISRIANQSTVQKLKKSENIIVVENNSTLENLQNSIDKLLSKL